MEYLKFGKNFKTDRQWKIIAIDYRQLNGINIDPKRLNYDSVRFSNIPEDIHIIACWLDYLKLSCNFLIEHESFPRTLEGDLCLYIPRDSILPEELERKIFGENSKIKLDKHRVRTIKLRGIISQGLVVKPEEVGICAKEGQDLTAKLGITKYEPPEKLPSVYGTCNKIKKRYINSNFHKYTDISNIKNYPRVFEDGEEVYISEKLHGTSFRAGWVKNETNTLWKKIKKLFGQLPSHEFIFGSRNVQLSYRNKNKYFYDNNVYAKTAEKYDLKNKLKMGEVIYGEIVGHKIQAGYSYGCRPNETDFYAYDLMMDDKWVNSTDFRINCGARGIPIVPFLFIGPYSKEIVDTFTTGASMLCPTGQPIREGCVIKPLEEKINPYVGRLCLKSINPEYLLLKNNSDFH